MQLSDNAGPTGNQKAGGYPALILQQLLEKARVGTNVPGICAALSFAGERAYAVSGLADSVRLWPMKTSSRFGIGCITKLFVSLVAHRLSREGGMDLDAPIDSWLDARSINTRHWKLVSIRHLLTHTTGMQGPLMFGISHRKFNWDGFGNQLGRAERIFAPGTVFNYENTGHVILGEIIQRASGKKPTDFINEWIFAPLGILPGNALKDYNSADLFVAPHIFEAGAAKAIAPTPFGEFWQSSLSDMTLSVDDLTLFGEALVNDRIPGLQGILEILLERLVVFPGVVSGGQREHNPRYFNAICAEYADGWFGYAGSALGQTLGFRFEPRDKKVCIVAMNVWLPIVRDALLDRLCGTRTHPDAGSSGGNMGIEISELVGQYRGGGNIVQSVLVARSGEQALTITFGEDGIPGPQLEFSVDSDLGLIPSASSMAPAVGFFRDPESGCPCLMVGVAALKKIA